VEHNAGLPTRFVTYGLIHALFPVSYCLLARCSLGTSVHLLLERVRIFCQNILLKICRLKIISNKIYTMAVRKSTSGELLTKQAMRKNLLYPKIMYILKLICNVVTAGTEALVVWGISFCMPVLKKSAACELSHILKLSINSLLLKRCDHNQFFRYVNRR
jgi:hypothetical protein